MLGLFLSPFGLGRGGVILAICAVIGGACAICSCVRCCKNCNIRDLAFFKWWFRATGTDAFDEFELLVQVHEVSFESRCTAKTYVKLTAGQHIIKTAKSKNCIFQEVLSIFIEQGVPLLVIELFTESGALLANLKLDIVKDVLNAPPKSTTSKTFHMTQKERGVLNPTVTLTLQCSEDDDVEQALLAGEDMETAFLMKNHLATAQQEARAESSSSRDTTNMFAENLSHADAEMLTVLTHACAGPLEIFSGFGSSKKMHLHVRGPPASRRFILGLWSKQQDMDDGKDAEQEVDVLKIQGVMADPGQQDVFLMSYLDKQHVTRKLRCRIVDRPTKVWVESLTLLITRVHNLQKSLKDSRKEKKDSSKHKARMQHH